MSRVRLGWQWAIERDVANLGVGLDDGLSARPVRFFGVGPEELVVPVRFHTRAWWLDSGGGGSHSHCEGRQGLWKYRTRFP